MMVWVRAVLRFSSSGILPLRLNGVDYCGQNCSYRCGTQAQLRAFRDRVMSQSDRYLHRHLGRPTFGLKGYASLVPYQSFGIQPD